MYAFMRPVLEERRSVPYRTGNAATHANTQTYMHIHMQRSVEVFPFPVGARKQKVIKNRKTKLTGIPNMMLPLVLPPTAEAFAVDSGRAFSRCFPTIV